MGVPATSGVARTKVTDMLEGDYIPFNYDTTATGVAGVISNIGTATGIEIPVTGIAIPNATNGNKAFFLKNDKGMLICDRIVQTSISWDLLNTAKYIEGKVVNLNSKDMLIRSLSGGCAYADANGDMSLTDKGLGAFPSTNEWDKYIVNSDLGGKIKKGDNNVWNYYPIRSWLKETPILAIKANTYRVSRGYDKTSLDLTLSNVIHASYGLRPVLEFLETNSKATTLFY